ncbi:MAG: cell surface protein, partial [Candidatus Solibacter usitatus]|nr:cell surface protein [Candidatus Solibacter usitatus]
MSKEAQWQQAKYSDGSTRVVNQLALYMTNNKNTADIDDNGVVTAGKRGDTFVFARFAKFTTGAEVIVLPNDKNFKWPKLAANNYIDD